MTQHHESDAKVILSLDFEIGWGDVTNGHWRRREAAGVYRRLRTVLPCILKEMDRLEISATWAAVGAMFEKRGERNFEHLSGDHLDIVTTALRESEWQSFDGRDLFELVISATQPHDIACHSYSHVPFSDEQFDKGTIVGDLARFDAVLNQYGRKTDRLVFPENREAYHEEISVAGYRVVRVAADNRFRNRWLYLATLAFVPPPPARDEVLGSGLVRHHGSMLFNDAGKSSRIPLLMRRVELGLSKAIRERNTFHIWAHPFNFAESDPLCHSFMKVLGLIASHRDAGRLDVVFM